MQRYTKALVVKNTTHVFLHTFNENVIVATEWHGVTRTTSVNIRENPMQKTIKKIS